MWLSLIASLIAAGDATILVRMEPGATTSRGAERLGGPYLRVRGTSAQQLRNMPGVRWALPEQKRHVRLDQVADPYEPLQWHLHNDGSRTDLWPRILAGADVNASAAWSVSEGSNIIIAILDGGIPHDHPDLPAAARVQGWDFVDNDSDPSPVGDGLLAAHGTAVAGLAAAARNGVGVVGVCPACRIMPLRVLANDDTARDGDVVAALMFAAEHADIIHASWSFDAGAYVPAAVIDAIRWAERNGRHGRGAVVVFSAGNRSSPVDLYAPAAMLETLSVAASDERDERASYSNFGPAVNLAAPGGVSDEFTDNQRIARAKLVTSDLVGEAGDNPDYDSVVAPGIVTDLAVTGAFSGTSAAAPLVSGAAGLVLAVRPQLAAVQVRWILTESAAKVGPVAYDAAGRNDYFGFGRLDAGAALALALSNAVCRPAAEQCSNAIDDDCDRAIDAEDPDCGAVVPPVFTVQLGLACSDDSTCGDGLCSAADGSEAVRQCTALCDFDCPDGGACVGHEGQSLCRPVCANAADCAPGTACMLPDASLVPPSQTAVRVCLPTCIDDTDCAAATCRDGACAGGATLASVQPPSVSQGCSCEASSNDERGLLLLLVVVGWTLRWPRAHRGRR